jgi:hypothetical protein
MTHEPPQLVGSPQAASGTPEGRFSFDSGHIQRQHDEILGVEALGLEATECCDSRSDCGVLACAGSMNRRCYR